MHIEASTGLSSTAAEGCVCACRLPAVFTATARPSTPRHRSGGTLPGPQKSKSPDRPGSFSVLATFGGAVYSDFLGRGKRPYLNPYLGFRLGYAYLDASRFAFGATAGVELFKHEFVLVDLNVRALGLLGKDFDTALVTGGNVVFAF